MRTQVLISIFLFAGCECSTRGGALSVTVEFDQSISRCVVAGVQVEGTMVAHQPPRAVERGRKEALVFGVARTDAIEGVVVPFARGYAATDCAGLDLERFDEQALGTAVDLDAPGVQRITLTLRGPGASDAGLDAGCGVVDCADAACDAKTCSATGVCGATADGGRACLEQGAESSCNDGLDNDGDGPLDCADPDCNGLRCDRDLCTPADACQGGVCNSGAPISCPPSTTACRTAAGQCVPSTGACEYDLLDAGAACDDGLPCTHSDVCGVVGTCVGTAYSCTSTTCAGNARCNGLGGCTFDFAPPTQACNDGASCTRDDRCGDGGVCSGTGYACSPPACFSGTGCDGDGGCLFTFDGIGAACPGGLCGSDAGCVRARDFPFVTSNFFPDDIPDASIAPATVFTGCVVAFDTTTNTSVDGGWCNQVPPTPYVFVQDGGVSTTVLPMAGLDLRADARLVFVGSRPVVLAVYGSANVAGVIDARSFDATRIGPGGNWSGCGPANGGAAAQSAGGGGAGFGTSGARGGGAGAGDGGVAVNNPLLRPLTGGCRGGNGHDSSDRYEAPGGPGGGAVQLSVSGTLTVTGTISTSGAGGQGGFMGAMDHNGGGGGGSGGAILLEAMQLVVGGGAKLTCNGGAGGGGREDGQAIGQPGQAGALDTASPAVGGARGTPPAGDGGMGAAGAVAALNGVAGVGIVGSGGGGAGLGIIRLNAASACSIDASALLSASVSRSAACP